MEIKTEKEINDNGSYTIKTVKTKTSADGFVPEKEMYPSSINKYGKYHKGSTKVISYQTNDPKKTRLVAYGISGIITVIGIFLILFLDLFLGICFLTIGIFSLTKSKKDIDKVGEKLKRENNKI